MSVAAYAQSDSGGLNSSQSAAIDVAMRPPQLTETDVIVKFPNLTEAAAPAVVQSLAADVQVNYDSTISNEIKVTDTEGVVVLDDEGREAAAQLPPNESLETAQTEDEVKAKKGHWILAIMKEGLSNTSIGIGMTKVQKYESSIWWQNGLPYTMQLISPSGDVQFNLKASSIGFLSKIKNHTAATVVHHTSINIGYFYYGTFKSNAQATGTGYDNPKTNPIYQWTGVGHAFGTYVTIQEELPFGFYMAGGFIKYENQWKMYIHQADCRNTHYQCPKINAVVYDADGKKIGARITLGQHVSSHSSIEFNVTENGDHNWAPNGFPPIWRNVAYTLEYRQRL